jgi:hypothetical protein
MIEARDESGLRHADAGKQQEHGNPWSGLHDIHLSSSKASVV